MEYKIRTLSPVHIGCGEKYTGLNFIVDNGRLYCVDPEKFISMLNSGLTKKFVDWIEKSSAEIDRLENKKRALRNSEDKKNINNEIKQKTRLFNLKKFIEDNKVNLQMITSSAQYAVPVQRGVFNDSEVNPFIKQMNSPYIPGTEIKGAIRTAVLNCALQDDVSIQKWLEEKLKDFQTKHAQSLALVANENNLNKSNPHNQRQKLSKLKEYLEKEMSRISDQFEKNVLTCKPDAKYDVMKFLQVGDSPLLRVEDLVVGKAEPFNMSNKFPIICEYLRPETLFPLTSFKLETNNSRTIKLDRMGFTESHKKLMSGLDVIMSCCHYFSSNLLREEISYFKKHGKASIVDHLQQIDKLNSPTSPVLRIGKDEGYNSLTIGLSVKKLLPDLYENVFIHATKNKSYDSRHGGPLPKSRKIVHWNGKEMTAGWVQLIPVSNQAQQSDINDVSKDKHTPHSAKQNEALDLSALAAKFNTQRR